MFDGLVMFAGYSATDLSRTDIHVLSVYGTHDGILRGDRYEQCFSNLPENTEEFVVDGANHAGFAYYGDQIGDNAASVSKEQQIDSAVKFCAEAILQFQNQAQ